MTCVFSLGRQSSPGPISVMAVVQGVTSRQAGGGGVGWLPLEQG